jgi:hypothetical protein
MWIKLAGFDFRKSTKKNKKYDVFRDGQYITSFGAIQNGVPMSQFFDKIGLYSEYNNNDDIKRKNYKKRHDGDRHNKYSAGWFSDVFLW